MIKEIICTACPMGCHITVDGEGENIVSVTGFLCPRGEAYARREFTHPVRILTTTVKVEGGEQELVPVRSAKPLPKEMMMQCMEVIRKTTVKAPVGRYDVIVKDVCGCGVDIVADCGVARKNIKG